MPLGRALILGGRLPGDIHIQGRRGSFYFPVWWDML
jgi:hypothetical protein